MTPGTVALTIDARAALAQISRTFGRLPVAVERAQRRALRKLSTWLKRQVLRVAAAGSGIPQKWFQSAMRYYVTMTDSGISVWIGTNEIKAHRLGKVQWNRKMKGARVARRSWAGSWSWGRGKTGPAVMYRTGASRLPLDVATVAIHNQVLGRLQSLQSEAAARFETLLRQELNYALNLESGR